MSTSIKPNARKSALPDDTAVTGPRDAAELHLYKLVMDGINSGSSPKTSIAELAAELRGRIRSKR